MLTRRPAAVLALPLFALIIASAAGTQAPPRITSPEQQFGAAIGDDFFLATYSQLEEYWHRLDRESDRMSLVDIGRTEEGRSQWMAVISAPENLERLSRVREISSRLAYAEGVGEDEARALAAEGRAVVLIAGGLHADEVLGSQQLIQTVYELTSRSDAETMRILRDVVVLVVDANPDGHELVAKWYMREPNTQRRTLTGIPRLYQKYAGHDNNRDFYMSTQAETVNLNKVLYREWFPQIVYDHHQTAPPGTVMFAPPFRGPFNYVFDPLIPAGIDLAGAAMHARFAAEQKAGVTMRSGSTYTSWWNGGLRTSAYFHNQIGLLTETIGSPTPTRIPVVPDRRIPSADLPYPIAPQTWHFRQSIDYSLTANRAVLDLASRHRETLLYNMYRMGRNSIERGSRDTWTPSPHREANPADPAARDPRGYIIPADQPDFLTATKFVTALLRAGVIVERATASFTVGPKRYPADSFVVRTAQAFRPYVLDMFEPQDHPDDIPYPGAPPTPPYDASGWTLAFQMGVAFDRVLDAFDGPFVRLSSEPEVPHGDVAGENVRGYLVSHRQNDAFVAVNRLLAAGEAVYWLRDRTTGDTALRTGAIYVATGPRTPRIVHQASRDLGLRFAGTMKPVPADAIRLRPVRIGLWDRYGGSEESGWIRWLLERYEFPFERVYAQRLDAGQLSAAFDVLIFPRGGIPVVGGSTYSGREPSADAVPPEFRQQTGAVTVEKTIPQLKAFVEAGGTLLAIGDSTAVATHFGLPVTSALTATGPDGRREPLARERFYVPGAVLRAEVDNQTPLGFGFEPRVDVYFDDSPAFRLGPDAASRGVKAVAWFNTSTPLRSGWAWGQALLKDSVAVVDARVGQGRVLLFGPEITFRGQPHGTFKFLFNGILYGGTAEERQERLH
jgi:hypothetical protein